MHLVEIEGAMVEFRRQKCIAASEEMMLCLSESLYKCRWPNIWRGFPNDPVGPPRQFWNKGKLPLSYGAVKIKGGRCYTGDIYEQEEGKTSSDWQTLVRGEGASS